jgi:hypothetical protein
VANIGFGVLGFDCWGTLNGAPNPNPALPPCSAPDWFDYNNPDNVLNWSALASLVATLFNPSIMEADVDGKSIQNLAAYRAAAPMFSITMPSANLMGTGVAGTYDPNGGFGYWIMLTPLSRGVHTIHFATGDGFLDVTDTITVR